jgi:nitrite reductase/ring-hydroxylating ferredoxin subunit
MEKTLIGSLDELREKGCVAGKVGSQPVCVFLSEGHPFAVDDRCPHMGFPLHRGSVENGLLTCHWHHARFDLASGGTLDPFADDVRAHDVEIEEGNVFVTLRDAPDPLSYHRRRLEEGLEQGLTLVMAKAVLGLVDALGPEEGARTVLSTGVEFGVKNREAGWGAGLTVLTAMANVLAFLDPADRPLALVHGLSFLSSDTRGRPPRFALPALEGEIPGARLESWFRRFVDTRNADAAERVLTTAATRLETAALCGLVGAATTDHVFIDGGHTIDFANKAFEALDHMGDQRAVAVVPTLARQMAGASRSEEGGDWRHPDDLAGLLAPVQLGGAPAPDGAAGLADADVDALAWSLLGDEPGQVTGALDLALGQGATYEDIARAVAYAAALRLVRFHTQNDHGDWDVVHHGFTAANATHQMLVRAPTPELARGVYQVAVKVFLDRFLNVPAARMPVERPGADPDLGQLAACWDSEGMVDEAGSIVYGWVRAGNDQGAVIAALGAALLEEDAEFHWYQTFEAATRQARAWPAGSEQAALILAGMARFLAAHTPTRRELAQVVRIARRLRRGEALYEEI